MGTFKLRAEQIGPYDFDVWILEKGGVKMTTTRLPV